MKILHIATTDCGGAAKGMLNLHYALLSQGIDSKILVAEKHGTDDNVYQMTPNYQMFKWSKNRFVFKIQKVLRRRGKCQTVVEFWNNRINKVNKRITDNIFFSSPYTNYNVNENPYVKEANIIHLHWVANFIDYDSFFKEINKPIIWTLRDENPGLGGFHYRTDKIQYGKFYDDIEDFFLKTKKQVLIGVKNITLIALSDEMKDFCKNIDFLSQKKIRKIYNPIDSTRFCLIDKNIARKALNIDNDSLIISFVSISLSDHRKGLAELFAAIKQINKPIKLLCMGKNDFFNTIPDNVICYGNIENESLQSIIYSASDIFVSVSKQESFGKTVIEALLCGVPVISTKVGVASEIINKSCGRLVDDIKPETIANAIVELSKEKIDREAIRGMAIPLFNPKEIANKYIITYHEALKDARK